jgi:hypothetical protein
MSEDERQRQMDFILNNLAQISAKVDALSEGHLKSDQMQRADAIRISRLEEAFVTLTQLSERVVERLDEHDARITTVENAVVILTRLVEQRNGGA